MKGFIAQHKWAFGIAIVLHVVLIALLIFGIKVTPELMSSPEHTAISAETVSADAVKKLRQKQDAAAAEKQRQAEEQRRQEQLRKQRERERQLAEERKKAEAKAKAEAERKAKAEAQRQAKLAAEKKAKEEAERKAKAEAERQAKLAAEKKAKEEAARKAQEEAERKAREQAKREAEQQAKQKRRESIDDLFSAEDEQVSQQAAKERQRALISYISSIKNRVESNWHRPSGAKDIHCRVAVQQLPSGEIVNIKLLESCGNAAVNQSVRNAIRRSEPLPQPPKNHKDLFQRDIEFTFEPMS